MKHHVFLSYSRRDKLIMQQIRDGLREASLTVWTDEGIEPGTRSWRVAIEDALLNTGCVVCILSPDANQSRWVRSELEFAEAHEIPIFLILARGDERSSIPFGFATFQWIDIRDAQSFEGGILTLISTLKDRLDNEDHKSTLSYPLLDLMPTPFDWCTIPPGTVTLVDRSDQSPPGTKGGTFEIDTFLISKYPITNAQYELFVEDHAGYVDKEWWSFSLAAMTWRENRSNSISTAHTGYNLPRTNVSWFDAVAYCHWLASKVPTHKISLPTEQQWQRAAQGDDGRAFPWGNEYDVVCANTLSSEIKKPTSVLQYPEGESLFGVMDMSGNVAEWCLTNWLDGSSSESGDSYRCIRGGSWANYYYVGRCDRRHRREPSFFDASTGFRIVLVQTEIAE